MSKYYAQVKWKRASHETYTDNTYSRGHEWTFDGGLTIQASSSPSVVPLPYSIPENVDPEEAYVASLSSCHMLFFLSVAAKNKFIIDSYTDNAIGIMEKNIDGDIAMTKVTLKPHVQFSQNHKPTLEQLEKMHHESHKKCFIANSVKTEVTTQIVT